MVKATKIIFSIILILSVTASVLLSGCENEPEPTQETTQATTQAPTEASTAAPASTDDTAQQDKKWNYSRLKLDSDKLQTSFDNIIQTYKFRGTAYFKIGNDFEYIGTSGFSDKDTHKNNSANTCYRIASLTKQFTAAAIMQLKEQGKINLDDTIDKYFPSYKYGNKITVKNLLTMTAGLRDYLNKDGDVNTPSYTHEQIGYKVKKDNSAKENKEIIINWILSQNLVFEPDSKFMYSNSSYYLLGDIIEQISGKSYEDYINENILIPAGMNSTTFTENEKLAKGYQDVYDTEWTLYPGVCYSAAGLISNVPDLLKWVDALCSNSVITKESFDEMTTPYKNNYGYGFYISGDLISHSGKVDRYNSQLAFTKDQNQICIILSNYSQSEPSKITRPIFEELEPYYN